jgi:hypothetical protein
LVIVACFFSTEQVYLSTASVTEISGRRSGDRQGGNPRNHRSRWWRLLERLVGFKGHLLKDLLVVAVFGLVPDPQFVVGLVVHRNCGVVEILRRFDGLVEGDPHVLEHQDLAFFFRE